MKTDFLNADQIAEVIFERADNEERNVIAQLTKDDLIRFHHGTGRQIRNEFKLWAPENPYTDSTDAMGPYHPDQYSTTVMEKVLDKCKEWVDMQ